MNDKHWFTPNIWIPVTNWQNSNEDAPPLAIIANNIAIDFPTYYNHILHCVQEERLHIIWHMALRLYSILTVYCHDIRNMSINKNLQNKTQVLSQLWEHSALVIERINDREIGTSMFHHFENNNRHAIYIKILYTNNVLTWSHCLFWL